ncbi:MAG TPA: RagB/SusD family nutrient uptake outer membrane protein [Bacteroides sp.]|nr:RagB/SusD family nutrient uptake outer membrane protein [Bacteroides sp.]
MKKRSRINPFLLMIPGTMLILCLGCSEDFFNRTAGDRITPDVHYKTSIDAEVSMLGAIITLQEAMPRLVVLDGLRSDMMDVTAHADANLTEINHQIFSPGNPYTDPADFYKVIININEVLANIDRVAENDREFDEYILYYAKGALISMRAWTYLTLVRLYHQAAYIEDNMTSLPEDLTQNVLSKEVMIDTLINQLIPYVFDASVGTERAEVKVTYYVNTKALLGELYLERNDYANAATYLKLACESYLNQTSLLKVDNTFADEAWSTIFLNAETAEVENISVIPFSSVEKQYNPLAGWFGYDYQYLVKPSHILVDQFMTQVPSSGPEGDLYRGMGVTFAVDSAAIPSGDYAYFTKYEIDKNDPFSSDIIISRAADIHLMLAEAYNRMGDEESQEIALLLVNEGINSVNPKPAPFARWARNRGIRGRVKLASREVPEELTGEDRIRYIEDLIMSERALELACEGKRWFDLVRVGERRNEPEYLADKVAAKFEGTSAYNEVRNRLMDPANWYLPFE